MDTLESDIWKKCSSCKKPIGFNTPYYVCSVSTCNGQRTGYIFCGVPCFEVHLPSARHKDAAAIEQKSPPKVGRDPQRTIIKSSTSLATSNSLPREVLIIASRLKDYIQTRSEMNTSANVMDVLSDYLRVVCDHAIENARSEGRKTVLDRDFSFLKK